MTEDDFFKLPPHLALRVLYDCLDEQTIGAIGAAPKREAPRKARFDYAIHKQAGYSWASEMDLACLNWWAARFRTRAERAAAEGSQWAAHEAKKVATLEKWIAWREWYPDAVWRGVRGDVDVTAEPPNEWPAIHQRPERDEPKAEASPERKPLAQDDDSFDPNTF